LDWGPARVINVTESLAGNGRGAGFEFSEDLRSGRYERLVASAAQHNIPATYEWRELVEAGGLLSRQTSVTGPHPKSHYVGVSSWAVTRRIGRSYSQRRSKRSPPWSRRRLA